MQILQKLAESRLISPASAQSALDSGFFAIVVPPGVFSSGRGAEPEAKQGVTSLKRKGYYVMTEFNERAACAADFMDQYLDACKKAAPLVRFVTKALGLKW